MTTNSIADSFITQYESEVNVAFQRKGSLLVPRVRSRTFQPGEKTYFQKVGKGEAVEKARHANISPMNIDHDQVYIEPTDNYTGDYIQNLDLLRTNINERQIVAEAHAFAQGRKTDDKILAAMVAGGRAWASDAAQTVDNDVALDLLEDLVSRDVPVMDLTLVVGPKAYKEFLKLDEFVNADYVPPELVAMSHQQGMPPRMFHGFYVMVHSALASTSDERFYAFHRDSIGHGFLSTIKSNIDWIGEKRSWFISSEVSDGSKVINDEGVIYGKFNTVA